jgi:carbonic anhydrase
MNAKEALEKLLDGNQRFVLDKSEHPNRSQERRAELLHKQKPFVAVVTCSDSRVTPTIIFDLGLGDVFTISNVGQVLTDESIGGIEYAVQSLGVRLVVILGHGNCGAVKAAVDYNGEEVSPNIKKLVDAIMPAVEQARKEAASPEEILDLAIKNNVQRVCKQLKTSESSLLQYIKNDGLEIVGAYYCLEVGVVEIVQDCLVV